MNEGQFPLAIAKLAQLGIAAGAAPLTKHPGCREYRLDERWEIAFNGHGEAKVSRYSSVPVPPYSVYVQYNGWPAGVVGFDGGIIAAGDCANEDAFIAAIEAAIADSSSAARLCAITVRDGMTTPSRADRGGS